VIKNLIVQFVGGLTPKRSTIFQRLQFVSNFVSFVDFIIFKQKQMFHKVLRFYSNSSSSIKTCIVGSGPAGFYASQYLLKHLPNVNVDLIEKLPSKNN
jgi:hypothetical protein